MQPSRRGPEPVAAPVRTVIAEVKTGTPLLRERGIRRGDLLFLLCLGVVVLTLLGLDGVRVYLSADAGHYLADADALFGRGVRESRHLPVYPALLGLLQLLVGDEAAVTLGMLLVIVALVLCFHAFVHGRLGHPVPEVVGTGFFILAPLMAEAVGWHGASMLLALALSLLAMRLVDEALLQPSWRRVTAAGVVCGLVGLTHPLPLALLAQVTVVVAVVLAGRAGWHRWRGSPSQGTSFGRLALVLASIGAITTVLVSSQLNFYAALRSPVSLAFDPSRLALLGRWAFREDPILWMFLLAGGVVLIPGGRRLAGEAGLRLGVWATAVSLVLFSNLLAVGGHSSYTTRYLYALPVTLGCTAAVLVALLPLLPRVRPPRLATWGHALVGIGIVACLVRIGDGYANRLDVALTYYNTMTEQEREAIRWLDVRDGTVAVTPKGGDVVAGTLYAWMIEGLADVRAIGTGQAYLSVLDSATADSLLVERAVSGSSTVENAALRVSASDSPTAPVQIAGLTDGDWFPLLDLSAGVTPATSGSATVAARGGGESGELSLRRAGIEIDSALTDAGSEVVISIRAGPGREALLLAVDPPPFAGNAVVTGNGRRASIVQTVRGRRVVVEVVGEQGVSMSVESDARLGGARLRLDVDGDLSTVLRVRVSGLDRRHRPVVAYRDVDLLRSRDVRYVFTWRETAIASTLDARRCFDKATENDEVLIYEIAPGCRRPSAPSQEVDG